MKLLVRERNYNAPEREFSLPLQTEVDEENVDTSEVKFYLYESKPYKITLDDEGEPFHHATLYLNEVSDENLLGEINKGESSFWLLNPKRERERQLDGKQVFNGQVDFVRLVLCVRDASTQEHVLVTPLSLCYTENEQDGKNICAMLKALLSFDEDYITGLMFERRSSGSRSALVGGDLTRHSYKPLHTYLSLLEEIKAAYSKHATYFQRKAHFRVSRQDRLMDIHDVREVRADDVIWLAQHAENLTEMSNETGIESDGKYYLPLRLQSADKYNSRDVYENRALYSFLLTVQKAASRFQRELTESVAKGNAEVAQYHSFSSGGKAPIITVKKYLVERQRSHAKQLQSLIDDLQHLLLRYRAFLPCPDAVLKEMPKATKIFLNHHAYREIFNLMHRWFHYGEMSIAEKRLIFSVKHVHKLFEYYCLQRLLQKIVQEGYALKENGAYSFSYPSPDPRYRMDTEVCNTYCFRKGNVDLTLYYEPVLYTYSRNLLQDKAFPNGLTIYRRGSSLLERGLQHWCPDFVLKIQTGDKISYAILDAKYAFNSRMAGLKFIPAPLRHLSACVDKYAYQSEPLPNSSIKMVFTLQGRSEGQAISFDSDDFAEKADWPPLLYGKNQTYGNAPVSTLHEVNQLEFLWKNL